MCVSMSKDDRERLSAFESAYDTFQAAHSDTGKQYEKDVAAAVARYQQAVQDAMQAQDPVAALRAADEQYREELRKATDSAASAVDASFRAYLHQTTSAFDSAGRHFETPSALAVVSQSLMLVATHAAPWAGGAARVQGSAETTAS